MSGPARERKWHRILPVKQLPLPQQANPDGERRGRIVAAMREKQWDVLLCALPSNVLLTTGYWPVVGLSFSITSADGTIRLLVPEDEKELAEQGWADEVITFEAASLQKVVTVTEAIAPAFQQIANRIAAGPVEIAYEKEQTFQPTPYSSFNFYGETVRLLAEGAFKTKGMHGAGSTLQSLKKVKTEREVHLIKRSCSVASSAFLEGSRSIDAGRTELEVAGNFRRLLLSQAGPIAGSSRVEGFAWAMSGPNSALASRAYAQTRARVLKTGDLVLVHCNSSVDGYWTDITRTYHVGETGQKSRAMHESVLAARQAALSAIRPGVKASEVDRAARDVLQQKGFGPEFKHPTGHGVGFAAISGYEPPHIHPKSEEVLESGMTFNVEPAVYVDGFGGIRHCDMVAVTSTGFELLTPFQSNIEELQLSYETAE